MHPNRLLRSVLTLSPRQKRKSHLVKWILFDGLEVDDISLMIHARERTAHFFFPSCCYCRRQRRGCCCCCCWRIKRPLFVRVFIDGNAKFWKVDLPLRNSSKWVSALVKVNHMTSEFNFQSQGGREEKKERERERERKKQNKKKHNINKDRDRQISDEETDGCILQCLIT